MSLNAAPSTPSPIHPTPGLSNALVLPGGGARAAYQVGVLKAIAELCGTGPNPFPILCGTSAGAINTLALASRADRFPAACAWLESLWRKLRPDRVYRSDLPAVLANTGRLLLSLVNAGVAVGRPVALLDNTPLKALLREELPFQKIGEQIAAGHLQAACVTAVDYTAGDSVSFFQSDAQHHPWRRWRRQGIPTQLDLDHLLASTAIPTIFPPQRIGRHYYGDGALRQLAPLSPALHLGAERVLVIPANGHRRHYVNPPRPVHSPALGQVLGHLLNSAFVDALELDIERVQRINALLAVIPESLRNTLHKPLRPIDMLVISPSQDIDTIAELHAGELPRTLRAFLRLTGSNRYAGGINTASYLLFTPEYIGQLIELGYEDGMAQRSALLSFFHPPEGEARGLSYGAPA